MSEAGPVDHGTVGDDTGTVSFFVEEFSIESFDASSCCFESTFDSFDVDRSSGSD